MNNGGEMFKVDADPVADAIYITLFDEAIGYSEELDPNRVIDYTLNRKPVGIELLAVSQGVKVAGLPEAERVEKLLVGLGIQIIR